MADLWDDQLRHLPVEAMAADLPARIRLRLRAHRSSERRRRLLGDGAMITLAIVGLMALAPQLGGARASLALGTLEGSTAWISQFGTAPAPAVWEALASGLGWTRHLASGLGSDGLLGMILVSVPLFVWLRRLLPERSPSAEASARDSARVQEGAAA